MSSCMRAPSPTYRYLPLSSILLPLQLSGVRSTSLVVSFEEPPRPRCCGLHGLAIMTAARRKKVCRLCRVAVTWAAAANIQPQKQQHMMQQH